MGSQTVVFLFSGQGSQYYQMGKDLYEHDPVFRKWVDFGSELARPALGLSLSDLVYGDRENKFDPPFDRTAHTHPALFILEYALAQTLLSRSIRPDICLGYSMGEYVSLALSEAITYEDGLQVLLKQAEFLEKSTPKAGMMAVLASPSMVEEHGEVFEDSHVAGVNYGEHFVLTAVLPVIGRISEFLQGLGIACVVLPVQRGFHSLHIDGAEEEFKRFASGIAVCEPRLEVFSSCLGRTLLLEDINADYLWNVVRAPVRFQAAVELLERREGSLLYVDAGPAGTLSAFVRQILGDPSRSKMVMSQFGRELNNIEELKKKLG